MVSSSAELSHTEMCLSDEVDYPDAETTSKKSRCFFRHTPRKSVVLLHLRNMRAATKGETLRFKRRQMQVAVLRRVKKRKESEQFSLTAQVMAASKGAKPFQARHPPYFPDPADWKSPLKTGSRRSPLQPTMQLKPGLPRH
jgi:hypothetical protein